MACKVLLKILNVERSKSNRLPWTIQPSKKSKKNLLKSFRKRGFLLVESWVYFEIEKGITTPTTNKNSGMMMS